MLKNNIIPILTIILIPTYLVRLKFGIPTTLFEVFIWVTLFIILSKTKKFQSLLVKLFKEDKLFIIGIILMILGGIISALISDDLIISAGLWKGFLLTPILAGLIIYLVNPRQKIIVNSFLVIGLLVALSAIWQRLTGQTTPDGRVLGIFGIEVGASPNYLSLFLTPIAVLGMAVIFASGEPSAYLEKRITSLVSVTAIVSIILAIIFSGSRAGIGTVVFCLVIIIWQKIRERKNNKVVNLSFGLVIIFMLLLGLKTGLPNFGSQTGERVGSSNNIRFEIWKTTIMDIIPQNSVFGIGMGRFQNYFGEVTKDRVNFKEFVTPLAVTPHNILLATWVNLGIIGLIGLVLVIWRFFTRVPRDSIWAITLLSILLLGIYDTPIYKNDLGAIFWIVIFSGALQRKQIEQ